MERGESVSAVALLREREDEAKQLAEWLVDIDIERARFLVSIRHNAYLHGAFEDALGDLLDNRSGKDKVHDVAAA